MRQRKRLISALIVHRVGKSSLFSESGERLERVKRTSLLQPIFDLKNQQSHTVKPFLLRPFQRISSFSIRDTLAHGPFQVLIGPLKTQRPRKLPFGEGLNTNLGEFSARNLAVGYRLLRIRKEEEQGDQESQANQTEEWPSRD